MFQNQIKKKSKPYMIQYIGGIQFFIRLKQVAVFKLTIARVMPYNEFP